MAQLNDAKARLAGVQARLAELQKGFDDAVSKKQVRKRNIPLVGRFPGSMNGNVLCLYLRVYHRSMVIGVGTTEGYRLRWLENQPYGFFQSEKDCTTFHFDLVEPHRIVPLL